MESKRPDRLAELLLEDISELLSREVNDPRIAPVTLTAAHVSKDLQHARIYFSLLDPARDRAEVLSGLRSATAFIRGRVARRLKLRFVPTIEFLYDEGAAQAARIEQLLRDVKPR
ncbi:MAG TPA: 30S ribosome-binding factor RbfA [Candidatus Acidoferrales bacterium]|nr:30S ribosome-binding factor RbfA [Candidatus Acidoferrales bacterium]